MLLQDNRKIKDFFTTITKLESCFLDTEGAISNISEKKILRYLKIANEHETIRKVLGWRLDLIKEKPDPSKIEKHEKHKKNLSRKKAFEYCRIIHERLKNIDGIFIGNNSDYKYNLVHNVWVFGSVAKGSKNPNDLDILCDYKELGMNKKYSERIHTQFFHFLTEGLRQISLHDFLVDNCLAKDHKIEIYPKFKLKL